MIKAVFFDFYNTLVKFWPPLDQIQQASCHEFGLYVSEEGIDKGYAVADVYFNLENERNSLALRSDEERLAFFARYEQMILENAGLSVSLDLARQIWGMAMSVPKDFIPFDDTIPTLAQLHADGYQVGILSNLRRDMPDLCRKLGLAPYLDFCISSAEVGAEKPNSIIFEAALERASAAAGETVHVGDQHRSDIVGARSIGIHPVLIDRGDFQSSVNDCVKISSLAELPSLLANAPQSLAANGANPEHCMEGQPAE